MNDLKIGLIGGSGLGEVLSQRSEGVANVIQTPFGMPSAPIIETRWDDIAVFFLHRHGVGHTIPPSQINSRANIFAMKKLGVTHIIASGAVGSLREEYKPRDLVIPDQIIDKTHRPSTFYERAAVHVEFSEPFCPVLRRILLESVPTEQTGSAVHDGGCYVCMEGPAFSTRAESLMHRLWGGDLIGMTAMPEAKLAKEAEISYALVALVTDYDCWKNSPAKNQVTQPDASALLKEIIGNLQAATQNAIELIRRAINRIASDPSRLKECPAREALKLAIWSDRSKIAKDEVERLAPLWINYFRS